MWPADGSAHPSDFSPASLKSLIATLASTFDTRHGGFGEAPKFPHPADLDFLLGSGNAAARDMALKTLRGMAGGGIFDQLGGGFARYSVDERWAIPHFEKMLYDNGPLLMARTCLTPGIILGLAAASSCGGAPPCCSAIIMPPPPRGSGWNSRVSLHIKLSLRRKEMGQ